MKFKIEEIPDEQLEVLGLQKKDIEKFPALTRNTLLAGNRTSLMRFTNIKIQGMDRPLSLDAKLSLERKTDGCVSLRLHPINHIAQNSFDLTKDEETQLQKEKHSFIRKEVMIKDGNVVPVLIALDKITNEYIAIKEKEVNIPLFINQQRLSDKQKADFIEGKEIRLLNNVIRFDPTKEQMVTPVKGNIDSIEFKHGKYNNTRLLIDIALLSSGLGAVVLLEHMLDVAANSKLNCSLKENLQNKEVRDAINTAIAETARDHHNIVTPDQLMDILTDKLKADKSVALSDIVNATSENNSINLKTNKRNNL